MVSLNELSLEKKVRKENRKRICKENRKKGQVESFGLVLIVVLLVLIFVFFIYIKVNYSSSGNADRILEIKANNLRNSILKSSLCRDVSIKDEIVNCNNGVSACGNCDELRDKINFIIINSIESNINYEFKPYELKRGVCREKIASSIQPLDVNLDVGIDLCYK